jgi:hypothetical protein
MPQVVINFKVKEGTPIQQSMKIASTGSNEALHRVEEQPH